MTTTQNNAPETTGDAPRLTGIPGSGLELARAILAYRGWDERPGQMTMIEVLDGLYAESAASSQTVSAPTGTGKSLANLCAAVASGRKVVYATSTEALQNQLRSSELPAFVRDVRELTGVEVTFAVLKGKDNYPCIHELRSLVERGGDSMLPGGDGERGILKRMLAKVDEAIDDGRFGDLDCEDDLRALSAATREKLATSKCSVAGSVWRAPLGDPGDVLAMAGSDKVCTHDLAFAHALRADILVVNTALLAANVNTMSRASSPDVAPQGVSRGLARGRRAIIIDEAHHATSIVASSMSQHVSVSDLADLGSSVADAVGKASASVASAARALADRAREADESMHPVQEASEKDRRMIGHVLDDLGPHLAGMASGLSEMCQDTAGEATAGAWVGGVEDALDEVRGFRSGLVTVDPMGGYLFDVTVTADDDDGGDGSFTMHSVPLDVSFFGDLLVTEMYQGNPGVGREEDPSPACVSCCSATIPGNLVHLLGLPGGFHNEVPSPFDPKRARLWVPSEDQVPSPPKNWRDRDARAVRDGRVAEAARDVVAAAGGRCLVLTTSNAVARSLHEFLSEAVDVPVLSQFEGTRDANMARFMSESESVLVATVGFWEGVDVPGEALSAVVVDKILFPHPGDAVAAARSKYVARHGGNPFQEVSVDHAATMMAQAFGRLIRRESDCGLVAILDPRVRDARYGALVLSKIHPATPVTRDGDVALSWLRSCVAGSCDPGDVDGWSPLGAPRPRARRGARSKASIKYNR